MGYGDAPTGTLAVFVNGFCDGEVDVDVDVMRIKAACCFYAEQGSLLLSALMMH